MEESEWIALTEWIEKQEGKGPWVVISGVAQRCEKVDLTREEEERLLGDENENEMRDESGDEGRKSEERRGSETCREKTTQIINEGSELEKLKILISKITDEKTKSDEVLKVVKDFCTVSTNMMKQYQEVLIGAHNAVSNMENIQKNIVETFEKQKKVFAMQTKTLEQRNAEINKQLDEMRANYNKIIGETKEELEKLKSGEKRKKHSDDLANKVKETVKFEFINKDSSLRRDYKLTSNTKFEHFYDYFTCES